MRFSAARSRFKTADVSKDHAGRGPAAKIARVLATAPRYARRATFLPDGTIGGGLSRDTPAPDRPLAEIIATTGWDMRRS